MQNRKRVVITGLGVVSSLGSGKLRFWESIIKGKSGISRISSFGTRGEACHYAGEIKKLDFYGAISEGQLKSYSRNLQFSILASKMAMDDARYFSCSSGDDKIGVILGTLYGKKTLEEIVERFAKSNKIDNFDKETILDSLVVNMASNVARYFKLKGTNSVFSTACAAGNYAIGYAYDLIKSGVIDCALAGASDYLSKAAFSGFTRLYAMAPKICRPFDKNRKGMLLGEGGAILFMETLNSALARGADIYAEVLGYGLSCDAYSLAIPREDGVGKAILKTLALSKVDRDDIDYISAHGTGTYANDRVECAAIKKVFGRRYKKIPVSSIKSMIGHSMSAASSIEALACCLALKTGVIPPTINFKTRDPECDIDCVPNKAQKKNIKVVLSNSFAFGGNNCCLVLKKWSGN